MEYIDVRKVIMWVIIFCSEQNTFRVYFGKEEPEEILHLKQN